MSDRAAVAIATGVLEDFGIFMSPSKYIVWIRSFLCKEQNKNSFFFLLRSINQFLFFSHHPNKGLIDWSPVDLLPPRHIVI